MASINDRIKRIDKTVITASSGNRALLRVELNQIDRQDARGGSGRLCVSITWEHSSTPEDDRQADLSIQLLLKTLSDINVMSGTGPDSSPGAERRAKHYVRTGSTADPVLN